MHVSAFVCGGALEQMWLTKVHNVKDSRGSSEFL